MARVAELVDALDLGSSRLPCESSSLSSRIMKKSMENYNVVSRKQGDYSNNLTVMLCGLR